MWNEPVANIVKIVQVVCTGIKRWKTFNVWLKFYLNNVNQT